MPNRPTSYIRPWSNRERSAVCGQLMEMQYDKVKCLADQVHLPMAAIKNHAQLVKALIQRWERLLVPSEEALIKINEVKED